MQLCIVNKKQQLRMPITDSPLWAAGISTTASFPSLPYAFAALIAVGFTILLLVVVRRVAADAGDKAAAEAVAFTTAIMRDAKEGARAVVRRRARRSHHCAGCRV
jgi:hypothetical protein